MKPILEVLVGKTVEQALLEVMEEEELANLRAQQRAFEELRNAEHVEQQRLEEQERRHREEKVSLKLENVHLNISLLFWQIISKSHTYLHCIFVYSFKEN